MSQNLHKSRDHSHQRLVLSKSKADTDHILSNLDNQLKRLGETVLPGQPYLLSVPSDVPYRHSSRFVNTWYIGTPFQKSEEQLQYMSFLPHQDEYESLLRVVGGWSDDHGNAVDEQPSPRIEITSGRNTPLENGNRKKISLKDYKSKDKLVSRSTRSETRSPLPIMKQAEVSSSSDLITMVEKTQQHNHNKVNGEEVSSVPQETKTITQSDGADLASSSTPIARGYSPRTPKRRKLSSGATESQVVTSTSPKANMEREFRKVPTLLSPTLPSPEREVGPPQLLSPLLPPSLAKMIATPPLRSSSADGNGHQRTDSVRSILANAGFESSSHSGDKGATPTLGGSQIRSDSQHSIRSNVSGLAQHSKGAVTPKSMINTPQKLAASLQTGVRVSPGPRQRHTIILKYGKKNRRRVEALLKLSARPKKPILRPIPSDNLNKVEHKPDITAMPAGTPEPLIKKRLTESEKRPSTPIFSTGKNEGAAVQGKAIFSTPKKDLKSASMRRVASTDGADGPPLSGEKVRVSTPLSVERTSGPPKASPRSKSTPSNREEDQTKWNHIHLKYFTLGRTIKHEATGMVPSPGDVINNPDAAKSVILLIEALLCFMVNTAAQSHARPSQDPGWNTIIPYHIYVFRASRKFPQLHGLVVQLGAVCRQLIHKYDMDRLARDPLPDEQCSSAPTPGSDGHTKTNEDLEKYKKRYLEFRDSLVRNAKELQTAWLDGSRLLSLDVLEHEYTETWRRRNKDSSLRVTERPTPTNISKEYFLPLDANTGAFEAMQFSLAFLDEWTRKASIDWNTRIDL